MSKAFQTYKTDKGKTNTVITLRNMYRASDTASKYDKLVILKAKRIVKLLR